MDITFTNKDLSESWKKVRANKGAPGVDGVSVQSFESNIVANLLELKEHWNLGVFSPQYYKNVTLKKGKKERILSIPAVADRIIHTALATKLSALFEPEFESISYGYRPNRSYVDAIKRIEALRDQGFTMVIDADIKGYFDHIPHRLLSKTLSKYLTPAWVNALEHVLLSKQMRGDTCTFGYQEGYGIPQGSPLSPLLANLYLDKFDEELLDRGEQIIRYADDFVVLLSSDTQANACLQHIQAYLSGLGLTLNSDKTRVTSFNEGFNFLGVSFIDKLTIPLKHQTEKALLRAGKFELELDDTQTDVVNQQDDDELNSQLWHNHLPHALQSLQAQIYDDDSGVPLEPDQNRLERLSLNHIARLKLTYIHKQGAVVHKRGNRFTVWFDGKLLANIPANSLDMILCFGHVHLTQAVVQKCLTDDITLVWLSQSGQYLGTLKPPFSGNPTITHAQVTTRENTEYRTRIARFWIKGKINNCLGVVRKIGKKTERSKHVEKQLSQLREKIVTQQTLASLRGTEGAAARAYFQWFQQQYSKDWHFNSRNRRPPRDPVNAMLSFGYTLLFHNLNALVQARGLLPHLGYLHGDQPRQPALTLDLMEAYRPWLVDELVWSLTSTNIITPEDFSTSQQGCWMNKAARKRFIQCFEQKLTSQYSHPLLKLKTDIRRLMDIQILELRNQLLSGEWALTELRYR